MAMTACATSPTGGRTQMLDMPLASMHSDLRFSISGGYRQDSGCDEAMPCSGQQNRDADTRFAQQVERVAATLQQGARDLYPDLAQRAPGMPAGGFKAYVVAGAEPGSASNASGRIALNSGIGMLQPYDDWLAFVIAREMGHVIARHHEENSAASIATSIILNILIPGSSLLKTAISAGGSGIAANSKRDVQVPEADAIAFGLLTAAGFTLRDVSLALLVGPPLLDDSQWSNALRESSAALVAEIHRSEFALAAVGRGAGRPLSVP